MKQYDVIGTSPQRLDGFEKVTGKAQYVADMRRPDSLVAKLLRSPHAHAIIRSIDVSAAQVLPGVAAVITWQDVPQIPFTYCGHPYPADDTPYDTFILNRHLRYVGEPVAAVAAESAEIAEAALALIQVDYELLPFYTDPVQSLAAGAVEIHEHSANIEGHSEYDIGDPDAAFAQAAYIVEDEFDTPIVTHSPIEPHVSLCEPDAQGRLTFYVSNQVPSIMRERLSRALDLRPGQVRIVKMTVGGGFGGKQEPVYEPINGALALAARRPVLLELTREECLACTRTRHATHIRLRSALAADGTLLGREADITANTGAYASHGHNVVASMGAQFCTLYPTPNLRFRSRTAYTNILIAGAMRGYGNPQFFWAMEGHIEHIARTLGQDPLEFRLAHICQVGDPINAGFFSIYTSGLRQVAEECSRRIGYEELRCQPPADGPVKTGVGVAFFSYGQSCYPWDVELSGARLMVNEDASATLFIGCTEIGQGADIVMAQIAAEALGVPVAWITVREGDTDVCPVDMGAYASRQTYVTGSAVKKAGLKCKEKLLRRAARLLERDYEDLDAAKGNVVVKYTREILCPLAEIARKIIYDPKAPETICFEESYTPTDNTLTFGATFAQVAVDTETGRVTVERLVSGVDCGRVINPQTAMGQLNGGNIMSLGFATSEQILIDEKSGRVFNDNLLDYKIPTFADLPQLEGFFVETEDPTSAYGNKSLGEPPNLTPAPAIRNAVWAATGVAVNQAPLTPERVFRALQAAKEKER